MVTKRNLVQAIIEKVENNYDDVEIRTNMVEGYKRPEKIIFKGNQEKGFIPDVLFRSEKSTDLYEIELDQDYKLEKWRLFSLYSTQKKGDFNIVTPEANLHQLRKLLTEHQINARIFYFS
ncbi:MAG: hypothetical protein U9N53_04510 [Bacteroidota bacterium]|nr:hypothetical protein [Bacteroidota bacterium]